MNVNWRGDMMYSVEYLSDLKREQDTEIYTRKLYGDNQSDTDVTDISFFDEGNEYYEFE